ncbi:MAG: hypothetical protein LBW85_08440, partial [Deltaproteobacteria bacterium]|nr:hypothetical protein [Deltaproteobacteria bacterium]
MPMSSDGLEAGNVAIGFFKDYVDEFTEGLIGYGGLAGLLDAVDRVLIREGLLERISPCPERREDPDGVTWGNLDPHGKFVPRLRIGRGGNWTIWDRGEPERGRRAAKALGQFMR